MLQPRIYCLVVHNGHVTGFEYKIVNLLFSIKPVCLYTIVIELVLKVHLPTGDVNTCCFITIMDMRNNQRKSVMDS